MPVTIGSLANVPAPGDPIRSPWAQDVSKIAVHPFASLAALKAQWPAPPDGAHGYLTDEMSTLVAKAGTWRWYHKGFPIAAGNTLYLTYGGAPIVAASSYSALSINGRALTLSGYVVLSGAATSGSITVGTMAAGYRPAVRFDHGVTMGLTASPFAAQGRMTCQPDGTLSPTYSAGAAPGSLHFDIHWTVTDLIAA